MVDSTLVFDVERARHRKRINQNLIFQGTFYLLFALFVTIGECIVTDSTIKHVVPLPL